MKKILLGICIVFSSAIFASAQVVDEIVAVIGEEIVLKSDVENQYYYLTANGQADNGTLRCDILEQLILNKLLLNKAVQDSIEVSDDQVESEVQRRIMYFVQQLGSEEALSEAYGGKSVLEIRRDLKPEIKEQLLNDMMRQQILNEITVTPREVKEFYKSIPEDSLPYLPAEVELYHIVIKPPFSEKSVEEAREELDLIYKMATSGQHEFGDLATKYSEGPTAARRGFLGEFARGQMVPEFDEVIFNLKEGEVSPPFQSQFGWHIAKLHKRLGDRVQASHILIVPDRTSEDDKAAIARLEEIKSLIQSDSLTFFEAAIKFSEDPESKDCGGCIKNPQTGELRIPLDMLDADMFFKVDEMKEGEISEPTQLIRAQSSEKVFHMLYLKDKVAPHIANLKDDYQKLANAAKQNKQLTGLDTWLQKAKTNIYINIKDETCAAALKNWN